MYNLIVGVEIAGSGQGHLPLGRLLERSEDKALAAGLDGKPNIQHLLGLPALVMPEVGTGGVLEVAQVGSVVSLVQSPTGWSFRFLANPAIRPISMDRIQQLAAPLQVDAWDLTRTRWSVKEADLYQALLEDHLAEAISPTAFDLPTDPPQNDKVAVMMPFGADHAGTWGALQNAAAKGGWVCQRADNIWESSVLINDIVSLIATSKVVICDLTGRNSNVFYETGIAHTLGREVIIITQSPDDVPFDLRHHRYIRYLGNSEGLAGLEAAVYGRLETVMSR